MHPLSLTWLGFEPMTSGSWQNTSCHSDALDHTAISDFLHTNSYLYSLSTVVICATQSVRSSTYAVALRLMEKAVETHQDWRKGLRTVCWRNCWNMWTKPVLTWRTWNQPLASAGETGTDRKYIFLWTCFKCNKRTYMSLLKCTNKDKRMVLTETRCNQTTQTSYKPNLSPFRFCLCIWQEKGKQDLNWYRFFLPEFSS